MGKELYHYCSNEKCFSILNSRSIRLSDIQKSNDYRELNLFYPKIFDYLEELYRENPFHLECDGSFGEAALEKMIDESYYYWNGQFASGKFSNFVLCFSEEADSLSQWRGYADNARGCCIAFSRTALESYCRSVNDVLQLKQVTYLEDEAINNKIKEEAQGILHTLKGLREWIVSEITGDNANPNTDGLLKFNFDGMLENVFIDSLQYKSFAFREEREWRLLFSRSACKNPDWICDKTAESFRESNGSTGIKYLQERIGFRYTIDDLIPYCEIGFDEFEDDPITSVWLGPKSNIRIGDLNLFLRKYGYKKINMIQSRITYR